MVKRLCFHCLCMSISKLLRRMLPLFLAILIGFSITGLTFFDKSQPVSQSWIGGSANIRHNGAPIKYYEEWDYTWGRPYI
jgi:uncharacterized membrane protein